MKSKKFRYANPALCKMFGYTEEEIIRFGVEDIHPKESLDHVIAEFIAQSKGEKALAHNIPCLRKDGSIFYADINTTSFILDGEAYNLGFFTDITEHKRAVDKLRESEERYRDIVETTAEWIWEMNLKLKHTFSNPRVKDILGYSLEEFLEIDTLKLIHPEDVKTVEAELPGIIAQKKGWQGWVLRWRHKDGSYRFLESNAVPIIANNGELVGFRGADRDITGRKISEDNIKASLQEKETLLAELYHRTRNNMQIIISILMLKSANSGVPSIISIFEDVIMRIEAMALVQEKLFKSKNFSYIDLHEYIEALIKIISNNYLVDKQKVVFKLEIEPVQTNIDLATPCGLVLNELITNSLKHAFPGDRKGEIYVKLWRDEYSGLKKLNRK